MTDYFRSWDLLNGALAGLHAPVAGQKSSKTDVIKRKTVPKLPMRAPHGNMKSNCTDRQYHTPVQQLNAADTRKSARLIPPMPNHRGDTIMSLKPGDAVVMKLGNIEQSILLMLLLQTEKSDADYTASMLRGDLKSGRPGISPVDVLFGSLYAALARLEEKGLVKVKELPPEPVQGGRKKSAFRPTEQGRAVARAIIDDLKNKASAFQGF